MVTEDLDPDDLAMPSWPASFVSPPLDDDAEAELIKLMDELAGQSPIGPYEVWPLGPSVRRSDGADDEFVREDEFTCRACHMVMHRSCLADPVALRCRTCDVEAARPAA
jgi:hypothetical protein